MDLLFVTYENRSLYVYIKDFDKFLFHKTKSKNKQYFCKNCLQCFSVENVLAEHKKVCLSINDARSLRLEKVTINFKNYFKQIPDSFKVYTDFQSNFESFNSYEGPYLNKYLDQVPRSFAYKLVCVDNKFTKAIVVFRGENAACEFLKANLEEHEYCKKLMKKVIV